MIDSYDVMLQGKTVGNVRLIKQGLYYHIQCSCSVEHRDIYRLLGSCGGDQIRFGVLIPEGNRLVLETKIPVKKLTKDGLEFWLEGVASKGQATANPNHSFKYIPIYPDEPFAYLTRLKASYLEIRNGSPGIMIKD